MDDGAARTPREPPPTGRGAPMVEVQHVLPLGAVIFSIGIIWGAGLVVGSVRTRLEQHSEELKKLGGLRDDISELERCVAKLEGKLKVDCIGRS